MFLELRTPSVGQRRAELRRAALGDGECALLEQLWEGCAGIPGVRLFGSPPAAPRTPTIALVVAKIPATEVAIRLARRGIFASDGNFYAQTVAERLGQARDGLVRLGCACYTTENEVDRVVESLRAIAQGHDRRLDEDLPRNQEFSSSPNENVEVRSPSYNYGSGAALTRNLVGAILAASHHHNPVTTFPLRLIQGLIGTLEYFGNPHPFTFADGGDPEADGERNLTHGGRRGAAGDT